MVNTRKIDWDILFKRQPNRYFKVYNKDTEELIEVHDKETGYQWVKIDIDRWMCMG